MNEAEFIVRRILKEAEEYSERVYEENKDTPGVQLQYRNKRASQLELINHLRKQFTNENN